MTEERLMAAVKHGDLDKASVLFDQYHRPLYGFFVRLTRDSEASRDLVQNVFYRMLKYKHTYSEVHPFKAWIYQIARNAFADHLKKNKMQISDHAEIEQLGGAEEGIERQWEENEKNEQLHESLAMLSDEDRQLLILSKFQRMKYEQIAVVMSYSVPNVKVKIHRAIKKLRDHYFELQKI